MTSPGLRDRLASLSPEQRELLRARLAADRPFLTPGQQRLWEAQRRAPGRPVDVVCQAVSLVGGCVDPGDLAERLHAFTQAHEALRMTFEDTGAGVRPVVHGKLLPEVRRERCADQSESRALARALAAEPFDLAAGPMLRAVIADGPDTGTRWLLLAVHNLVFDAWSFELLLDYLAAPVAGQAPARPFSEFARQQRIWCQSAAGRQAAAYWAGMLDDPPPALPADWPRAAETDWSGRRLEFTLPAVTGRGIAAAARRDGATAYAGWLAVVWAVLEEFSGIEDTVLGTFIANRGAPGAMETVGYLLNVLPMRLRAAGRGSHRERTRAASLMVREGLRHAAYPGELIARDLPAREPGTHPMFDAAFVFDNVGGEPRRIQGAEVTTADVDKGTSRYDLTFAVYPSDGQVTCWVEYSTSRYREATARRLAERFAALAAQAAGQEAAEPAALDWGPA